MNGALPRLGGWGSTGLTLANPSACCPELSPGRVRLEQLGSWDKLAVDSRAFLLEGRLLEYFLGVAWMWNKAGRM